MWARKGMITIFVILGILLLIGAGIFIFAFNTTNSMPLEDVLDNKDSVIVTGYTTSCLETASQDGLSHLLEEGFLYKPDMELFTYNVPVNTFMLPEQKVDSMAILLQDQKSRIPNEKELNNNLALHIQDSFKTCFNESKFAHLDVEFQDPEVKVDIDEITKVDLRFPIIVKDGEKTQTESEFNTIINYNVLEHYDFTKEFLKQSSEEQSVPINYLMEYAYLKDYTCELISLNSVDVGFRILITDYQLPLNLKFLGRFN